MFDFGFVMFIIFIAVLAGVARIIWSFYVWYQLAKVIHQVFKAYNQQIQNDFVEAARAVHRQQERAAREAARRAEEAIREIPTRERRRHRQTLKDIMNGRVVLNPRTGELEQA
jgi:biopolymer transport protein ExbB/TolQ